MPHSQKYLYCVIIETSPYRNPALSDTSFILTDAHHHDIIIADDDAYILT